MKNTIIGWAIGFTLLFGLNPLVPKATCADGWKSHSIGQRGACSHHGGVRHSPWGIVVFILSVAGGVFVTHQLNKLSINKKSISNNNPLRLENPNEQETPYGSLTEYQEHLRKIGVCESQIKMEINKYKARQG